MSDRKRISLLQFSSRQKTKHEHRNWSHPNLASLLVKAKPAIKKQASFPGPLSYSQIRHSSYSHPLKFSSSVVRGKITAIPPEVAWRSRVGRSIVLSTLDGIYICSYRQKTGALRTLRFLLLPQRLSFLFCVFFMNIKESIWILNLAKIRHHLCMIYK